MSVATVTSKSQITIPADVRRSLRLTAGSRLNFVPTDHGSYEIVPATGSVTELKGMVPAPTTPVSLEDMDTAIAQGAVESLSS